MFVGYITFYCSTVAELDHFGFDPSGMVDWLEEIGLTICQVNHGNQEATEAYR